MAAADAMARWVRHALAEIRDGRPFTDSETGPIHTFKDLGITLPDVFDLSYFRHMAWAHLASGGAGGGMRWPNRHPHTLTPGMRQAQGVMADFARLIDWRNFAARNVSEEVRASPEELLAYACGDDRQAVVWVLRDRDSLEGEGELPFRPLLTEAALELPPLEPGTYLATCMETHNGHTLGESTLALRGGPTGARPAAVPARPGHRRPTGCGSEALCVAPSRPKPLSARYLRRLRRKIDESRGRFRKRSPRGAANTPQRCSIRSVKRADEPGNR